MALNKNLELSTLSFPAILHPFILIRIFDHHTMYLGVGRTIRKWRTQSVRTIRNLLYLFLYLCLHSISANLNFNLLVRDYLSLDDEKCCYECLVDSRFHCNRHFFFEAEHPLLYSLQATETRSISIGSPVSPISQDHLSIDSLRWIEGSRNCKHRSTSVKRELLVVGKLRRPSFQACVSTHCCIHSQLACR